MNKNHRIVWSPQRQAFIVAHEAASSGGGRPGGGVLRAGAQAALLVLSASSVQAWAACPTAVSGVITVSSASSSCSLGNGESIVITSGGTVTGSSAISISGAGTVAGTIQNAGFLDGTADTAIYLYNSATLGAITNTGTIHGLSYGIILSSGTTVTGGVTNSGAILADELGIRADGELSGGILNSGLIDASSGYGMQVDGGMVSGGITNSGTIQAYYDALYMRSGASVSGGITNSGFMTSVDSSPILIDNATVTGGITNAGTISAELTSYDQAGITMHDAVISGGITNTGLIHMITTSEWVYGIDLDQSVLTGSISNSGTIQTAAPSTSSAYGLRVSDSSITGGITNSGLIQAGDSSNDTGYGIYVDSSALTGSIVNTGTIQGVGASGGYGIYLGGATVGAGITNSGMIEGSSLGIYVDSSSTVTGGIDNAGVVKGGQYSLELDNASDAFTVANTGTLDGAVLLGINTLDLNGTSSRVIGNTFGSGTVNVNGTFTSEGRFVVGDFDIASTGFFNMNHGVTVSGSMVNDGVLNVGAGAQTVSGTYAQGAGGTFRFSLSDASTYGSLHVTGNATVADGAKVFVNVLGSPTLSNGATVAGIITTSGTLTADASTLSVADNSALYKFTAATVSAPGSALDLVIEADPDGLPNSVEAARLPAARGAAQALQTIFNNGVPTAMQPVFDKLNNLTEQQAAEAISQTLPTVLGAGSQAGINALHSMNKVIQSRVESNQGLSSGNGTADRYMWVRAFGNWGDQKDRRDVSGFESDTAGLVIGGDAPVSDRVRAGGAFTYARSRVESKSSSAPSRVDVDTYELVGYASYNIDPRTDINYQIDVGQNKASSLRQISFMGTQARADFDSVAVHASVGIGRVMPISAATNWTPSVRLDYTHMRTEGYTEEGAGALNLDVQSQTYREFLVTGDAKLSHQFENGAKLLTNVSLGYDAINKQAKTTSTFTGGGPAFVTEGLKVAPWFYRFGVGLVKETGRGMEYSVRYDMEGRTSGYLNQTVSAKVRWAF